jgi:hypothetical protein
MTEKVTKYLKGIEKYNELTDINSEERVALAKELDRLYLSMTNQEREYIENYG